VNTLKRQRGLSMLAWMVIGSMAGLIFLVALKLMPLYLEHYNVVQVLEQMRQDSSLRNADKQKVIVAFAKRLSMNGVKNLTTADYAVTKGEDKTLMIEYYYEVRTPLFSNLSMVVEFEGAEEVTSE
jgi:hypothetical protein